MLAHITSRLGTLSGSRDLRIGDRRPEHGATLIEAALVLPILLMLFLGLFAFARGWSVYVTMTRAAREGLREAVTTTCATCGDASYSSSQIQSKFVFPALQAVGINTSEIQNYTQGYTWMDTSDNVCGEYIDFQYPYTLTIPFLQKSITTVTLQTQIQMRLENQPLGGTCS